MVWSIFYSKIHQNTTHPQSAAAPEMKNFRRRYRIYKTKPYNISTNVLSQIVHILSVSSRGNAINVKLSKIYCLKYIYIAAIDLGETSCRTYTHPFKTAHVSRLFLNWKYSIPATHAMQCMLPCLLTDASLCIQGKYINIEYNQPFSNI